jgi:hypothetical protein
LSDIVDIWVEENVVHRSGSVLLVLLATVLSVLVSVSPALAKGSKSSPQKVDWAQRDTAVYVVSTLNLLHNSRGEALVPVLAKKYDVTQYRVLDDLDVTNLYFVQLRSDQQLLGTVAYEMGWQKPMSVSSFADKLGIRPAPGDVLDNFRADPKKAIGTFTSTLPQL